MREYRLNMSDYRYKKEVPVLIGTMTITIILVALMFIFAWPLGVGFLLSILLLFINLYIAQMRMLGSCVKVSETQFPKVYRIAKLSAERLDINLPPVYIMQSPVINAFATGFFGNYYTVFHSALLEACTDEELMFIIGHEFSHIKGNHVMLNALMNMGVGNGMRVFPGLSWLQWIIQFVFLYLSRCFEYTCDRGGLIANGEVKAFITAQTKLAVGKELFNNLNIMEFYKQALELDKKPFGFMAELETTHPLIVNRIRQAVRYYRSEDYRRIAAMQGKFGTSTLQGSLSTGDLLQRILEKPDKKQVNVNENNSEHVSQEDKELCRNCGSVRKGSAPFCVTCGMKFEEKLQVSPEEQVPEVSYKFCISCGTKNIREAKFCSKCGKKF